MQDNPAELPDANGQLAPKGKPVSERVEDALRLESMGVPRVLAAKKAGVGRDTMYRRAGPKRKEGPETQPGAGGSAPPTATEDGRTDDGTRQEDGA